jgi:hypothetical protein
MSEESREPGAVDKEREMREHEREVREGDVPDDAGGVTPAPPPNVQHGSVSQ